MKHTKLFEGFLAEKKGGPSCSSSLCTEVMPGLQNISDMVIEYTPESPSSFLVKIQGEVNKIQKIITETIRGLSQHQEGDIDWEKAPKAPIFVLTLAQRYPQTEKKYHDLWYKAAERQPVFSYGGAIAIFKTYCKREDLVLEEHDYGFEGDLSEAEHQIPFDYKNLRVGDSVKNADGSPMKTTDDGKRIVVLNKGIALLDDKLSWAEIMTVNVLGKDERCSVAYSNLKEIAKNL